MPNAIRAGILAMVCRQRETVAFKSSDADDVKASPVDGSVTIDDRLALSLPYGSPELPPDLAAVMAAWSDLPVAIKAGILAMVKAASK